MLQSIKTYCVVANTHCVPMNTVLPMHCSGYTEIYFMIRLVLITTFGKLHMKAGLYTEIVVTQILS